MSSDAAVTGGDRAGIARLAREDTPAARQLDHLERQLRRLALDIHDSLAQSLCAAQLQVETIDVLAGDAEQKQQIAALRDLIDHALAEVSDLVGELRPAAVDAEGLIAQLREYCDDFAGRTGLDLTLAFEGDVPDLSPSAEIAVFRIVQESLNNVHKHASARGADVYVQFSRDELVCRVVDNGNGFDTDTLDEDDMRDSHGIKGMKERAALLDGTVEVSSASGSGTTVTVRIPVWK